MTLIDSPSSTLAAELFARFAVVEPDEKPIEDRSFLAFKKRMDRNYRHAKHQALVDAALLDALRFVETEGREGYQYTILVEPPRHGKTYNLAQMFPAYVLGKHPDWRILMTSYAKDLIQESSRYVRNYIESEEYQDFFPGVHLAHDSHAVTRFNIAGHRGGLNAMGVGGGVTGKGGHILIADDILSGRDAAESALIRQKTWKWWTDDFYTRRNVKHAAIILSGTRWHMDDPIGRAIAKEPWKWRIIVLPALYEPEYDSEGKLLNPDLLGRQPGEALWEEQWSREILLDIKGTQDGYSFSSLYQGSPVPLEGGLFKRRNLADPAHHPILQPEQVPPIVARVRAWDLAMSSKTAADYTVGTKYALGTDAHRYVEDVNRAQIEWDDLTEHMAQVMIADGREVAQYVENKGYMSRAIQALNIDPRLHGYRIFGVDVDTDKYTRALPLASKVGAGVVHLVAGHWIEAWLSELCSFPFSTNDDQVDSVTMAEAVIGDAGDMESGVWYAE